MCKFSDNITWNPITNEISNSLVIVNLLNVIITKRGLNKAVVIRCRSVTKQRQRHLQVVCGVGRRTAAGLRDPSLNDQPSHNKLLS